MAHKKGGGSSTNGRDSHGQRLGVKRFGGQHVNAGTILRSEEHTSELQSRLHLVCRLLLEKKKKKICYINLDLTVHRPCSHIARLHLRHPPAFCLRCLWFPQFLTCNVAHLLLLLALLLDHL